MTATAAQALEPAPLGITGPPVDLCLVIPAYGTSKNPILNTCRGVLSLLDSGNTLAAITAYGPAQVTPWSSALASPQKARKHLNDLQNQATQQAGAANIVGGIREAIRTCQRSSRPSSSKIILIFVDGSATPEALVAALEAANDARNLGYSVRVADVDGSSAEALVDDVMLVALADPNALFVGNNAVEQLYEAVSRPRNLIPAAGVGEAVSASIRTAFVLDHPVRIGDSVNVHVGLVLSTPASGQTFRLVAVGNDYFCGGYESSVDIASEAGKAVLEGELSLTPKFSRANLHAGVRALRPAVQLELYKIESGQPPARVPLTRDYLIFPFELFTGDVYNARFYPKDGRSKHTVLFHGSAGSGKSSLTNSIFASVLSQSVRASSTGGSTGHVTRHYRRFALDSTIPFALPFAIAEMPGKDDHNFAGEELAMACGGLFADGDAVPLGQEAPLTLRDKLSGTRLRARDSAEIELERAAPVVVFVISAEEARGADVPDGAVARLQPHIEEVIRIGRRILITVTRGDDIANAAEAASITNKLVRALAVDRNSVHIVTNNVDDRDKHFEKDKAAYLALLAMLEDACTVPRSVLLQPYGQSTAAAASAPGAGVRDGAAEEEAAGAGGEAASGGGGREEAAAEEPAAADVGGGGEGTAVAEAGEAAAGTGGGGEEAEEEDALESDVEWSGDDEADLDVEEGPDPEGPPQAAGPSAPAAPAAGGTHEQRSPPAGPLARLASAGRALFGR
eukprot:tig00021036_g17305.t1